MKQSNVFLITAMTALLVAVPLHADEAHHKDGQKKPVAAPAQPRPAATLAAREKKMQGMQMNMLKMHEQMHKIMQAKDPKERQRLMQEHMKTIQDQMKMMGGGMHHMKPCGESSPSGNETPHAE